MTECENMVLSFTVRKRALSFLAHLSWKLKWAFLITCRSSSVRSSVNFSHFHLTTKLGTKYPWVKGIQVCSNKEPRPSQRGGNREIIKMNWQLLKIFFSRTTLLISTKLGTEQVMWIQVPSNEGQSPSQRGDNCEIVKIHWKL